MGVSQSLRATADWAATVPGIRHVLEALYERRFTHGAPTTGNWYRGVFSSFAEVQASAPTTRPLGYDNQHAAALYRERARRVYISDYPVMLWLARLFESGNTSVFDIGGHIGIAYYAYQRYVRYPDAIRWRVLDVPAVIAAGAAWAHEHDVCRRLEFTERPADADGCDILFASGSLQYLDYTLADLLGSLAQPPRHLLVNLMPIHMNESFFTLQNMGAAYCPYRIMAEREFIDGLKALGYTQQDRWENPDRRCEIAYRPAHSLDRYFGFYFSR
ncbi:methyltransferase, TIGR04325 family [Dokdonella soli]|uniref:Methyltransferase, TIGR04325 family n=1 Tax=Dokdonella soli TaxID=529810 RepID=A0ABP3TU03_9GAMM